MKRTHVLVCLASLVWLSFIASPQSKELSNRDHQLVRVYGADVESTLLYKQMLMMDIDIIYSESGVLKALVTKEQKSWLTENGLQVEQLDLTELFDPSVFGVAGAGLYHTYNEVELELHQIELTHGSIAKVFDIGNSIEGREIWAIKISDNPSIEENGEAAVLYMGAHHAREWISVEVPMNLAHYLVNSYGHDPRITNLVDEREVWIVPMVNPDGVEYSQQVYQMWRKNKRDNNRNGHFDPSVDGVDNNRNYGYMWGYDNEGSSPYTWSEMYRGAYAFSEPENQAIRNLVLHRDFVFAVSYHSYGQLMLYPWGYIDADTPDHKLYTDIAAEMARFNGYTFGNAKDDVIYNTNGDADDWLYGERGTLAYTFELGTMFVPPESQIEQIWLNNREPALYLLEIADDPCQIYPAINIYADKSDYSPGDSMEVGLNLTNPQDEVEVGVYVWVDRPNQSKYWILQEPQITIPAGVEYSNPIWRTFSLPLLPAGNYSWHAVVVDPATEYILSESLYHWKLSEP
ncbi:MAG: zinc carboxypeptidase [Candidatus Bathyarchaeota archaeon]|nr:MAG: zinc carboxypeptidase [Candidatus Bathyarchaeota archaeon]